MNRLALLSVVALLALVGCISSSGGTNNPNQQATSTSAEQLFEECTVCSPQGGCGVNMKCVFEQTDSFEDCESYKGAIARSAPGYGIEVEFDDDDVEGCKTHLVMSSDDPTQCFRLKNPFDCLQAYQTFNLELCNQLTDDDRYSCYTLRAVLDGDLELCKSFDDKEFQFNCYLEYGRSINGVAQLVPGYMFSDKLHQEMFWVIVETKDAEYCETKFKGLFEGSLDKCYGYLGIQLNDLALCDKADDWKPACYEFEAQNVVSFDFSTCNNLETEHARLRCQQWESFKANDSSFCLKYDEDSSRDYCYYTYALYQKGLTT